MKKSITKILTLSLFLAASVLTNAIAQKPVKVLFIGNSYTYMPRIPGGTTGLTLPEVFKGLANAAGKTVTVLMDANGGQYFPPSDPKGAHPAHGGSAFPYRNIRSQPWDYFLFQKNQVFFAGFENHFPTFSVN